MNPLWHIAQHFSAGEIVNVEEYGSGNVNDTYRVTVRGAREPYFILQRINTHVFRRPELIMLNLRVFSDHVQARLARAESTDGHVWQIPRILATHTGATHYLDEHGAFWRALSFIDHARTHNQVNDLHHAGEVGYALGKFHHLISDLSTDHLHDTLEGFHIAPRYLQQFDEVATRAPTSAEEKFCFAFVQTHRGIVSVLEDAKAQKKLRLRPIHGDPKVNNIMIDDATGRAVSVIDLDTVKPGLVHYDIGDCLRSCCNPLGEETLDFEAVRFEPDICRAVLQGYFSVAKNFLDTNDHAYLFDAIRLLAFELGVRFFTDYLAGNVYFKTKSPEHNLHRALVQFKLTASIVAQERRIRALINDLR